MTTAPKVWPRIPYVGVGCIVTHQGRFLMVRSPSGLWSPPGGHLDFGETPAECAIREAHEETGVVVPAVEFVALTNDFMPDVDKHYVTIWMRGETTDPAVGIGDPSEVTDVGWFELHDFPRPLFSFFENLIAGRCFPAAPANSPFPAV